MERLDLINEITRLKKEKNAVIVAHNYQIDDIQEIADLVGDSFALSRYCAESEAKLIVFCGVHFMAESAKILSPDKIVLLPEIDAGCPMADMVNAEGLAQMKNKYPNAKVVCYINSSAEVKALSDVCCTSSNALDIVNSIDSDEILFVPDQNLGNFVANQVKNKRIILWEGYCITHHRVSVDDVKNAKDVYPDALLLIHPECKPEVVKYADFVGSTKQIIDFAKKSNCEKFIIGTEMGILYQLKKDNPEKKFYLLSKGLVCPNMKKTRLESVYNSLLNMNYQIILDNDIIEKSKSSLIKMLEISK